MKNKVIWLVLGLLLIAGGVILYGLQMVESTTVIDFSKLSEIKTYTIEDYNQFVEDYQNNNLDDVYITKFLYDGAGVYKTYDLDDFIEEGNDLDVKTYEGTVINIHKVGSYELKGELTGGMVAVNTNHLKGEVHLTLNGVNLDTDSKKIPAIYVYNKDITYSDCNVVIEAQENTINTIKGGKFKKVSLVSKEELDTYQSKYSGEMLTNYTTYTNYYGVYTKEEIENVLFATVTADQEDLADGDPYYYYKGSGAISSDIDLTFEGKGTLTVISKNKEGIETKGHLTFSGGVGDYTITAFDDCLNTTTSYSENSNAHNNLTIDVHSLTAVVDLEADEGDAIDSNGTLVINGGTVIAIAKPGQDAGIDSEKGTTINGGVVLATGDMLDPISSDSKQNFITLGTNITANQIITLLDSDDNLVFSYETDRKYSYLVYSSSDLTNGTYHVYRDGSITGNSTYGFYTEGTYTKGIQLGYTSTGNMMGGGGMNGEQPQGEPPEKPEGEMNGGQPGGMGQQTFNPTNADFTISGISNIFNGVGELVSSEE